MQQDPPLASQAPSKLEPDAAALLMASLMIELTVAKQRPQFGRQPSVL